MFAFKTLVAEYLSMRELYKSRPVGRERLAEHHNLVERVECLCTFY
jgi:hypothetical protein